ncbi:hypothetical protein [Erythrobacter sp. THAF29]|uniref:hypothetical protein n=1 Tax=Erythrobacter sp. THAF29 TaxID=2587851 RepID=UPI0012680187|nr:hypothetical protein [Erythrobacter sp. THAF29]QFT76720.1 hypothetical protein FIU90_04090 [Erythrobacter sp. THAF29]
MQTLSKNPAAAYRRVDLDARIEASQAENLTRLCLEEVVGALGQAEVALERAPDSAPRDVIARAHSIALWLARSVAPDNPLHSALVQFYGGLAALIARNLSQPKLDEIRQARDDFADLLAAV